MSKYIQQLRKANLIESKNHATTLQILETLIENIEKEDSSVKNPTQDVEILKSRIQHLHYLKEHSLFLPTSTPKTTQSAFLEVDDEIDDEIEQDIDKIIPPIVEDIFTMLINSESIEYGDYFSFYKALSGLFSEDPKAIVKQKAEYGYFVGDTHGSYSETIIMVNYFEELLQKYPNTKIVFLGDYVDRNPYDLENLTLIIAFWAIHQKNVTLIRGNHEDPKINDAYGFIQNLMNNFGIEQMVNALYAEILKIFTNLPIAHILEILSNQGKTIKTVFSVHGGIPINNNNPEKPILIKDLEKKIQIPVNSYEDFDDLLNWLLWADPKEDVEGFVLDPNTGRNQFGPDMFQQFISANNIDIVVRAHEVLKNGYKEFFDQKLISLFSTSYYKNRKIGDGAFLRISQDPTYVPLPIETTYLAKDLKTL